MLQKPFNIATKSLCAPIPPLKGVTGWKELPLQECGEPLVPLGPFSAYPMIFQDAIYQGERSSSPYRPNELNGCLITPFVRQGIAEKLAAAAKLLPEGYALMIWDSYRPLAVQQALYDDFYQQLVDKKGLSPEEATVEAQRFVSIPSKDPAKPPPHNTGGTVDLTIVKFPEECWEELKKLERDLSSSDWKTVYTAELRRLELLREKAKPLNMGTVFDEVSARTLTRYYEEKLETGTLTSEEQECLQNRRLLFNVMQQVGLSNYPEEWWHFDGSNQFDSIRTGRPAIYGAAAWTQECQEWEDMRRWHLLGVPQTGSRPPSPEALAIFEKAFKKDRKNGDLHYSLHPTASRLQIT